MSNDKVASLVVCVVVLVVTTLAMTYTARIRGDRVSALCAHVLATASASDSLRLHQEFGCEIKKP